MHAFSHEMTSRAAISAASYYYKFVCVFTGTAAILATLAAVRMSVPHPVIHPARRICHHKFYLRAF
jgi:hypothetical protein